MSRQAEIGHIKYVDFKVPAKIVVWFLETGRFLPVSLRVPWFLFRFWIPKRCCTLKSSPIYEFLRYYVIPKEGVCDSNGEEMGKTSLFQSGGTFSIIWLTKSGL